MLFFINSAILKRKRIDNMKMFRDIDENQYWLTVWSLLAAVFITFVTMIAISAYTEDRMKHDLVAKGHDPIALACLFNSDISSVAGPCLLLSQAIAKSIEAEMQNDTK